MDTQKFEKPVGYKDSDDLSSIVNGEKPLVMISRLLAKTGPVEETIKQFCLELDLKSDSLQSSLLQVAGAIVSAMGRRAQRKFPDSDPKELIRYEWESSFKAYNFVATILNSFNMEGIEKVELLGQVKPSWQELKPAVKARLKDTAGEQISPQLCFSEFRKQLKLEQYDYLEKTSMGMFDMTLNACYKSGVELSSIKSLTERIIFSHYPNMPEYQPALVNELPLAYETKVLDSWKEDIENVDTIADSLEFSVICK